MWPNIQSIHTLALLYSMNDQIQSGANQSLIVTTKSINDINFSLVEISYLLFLLVESIKMILSPKVIIDKSYIFSSLKSLAVSVIFVISSVIYYFTIIINTYIDNGNTVEALSILLFSGAVHYITTQLLIKSSESSKISSFKK